MERLAPVIIVLVLLGILWFIAAVVGCHVVKPVLVQSVVVSRFYQGARTDTGITSKGEVIITTTAERYYLLVRVGTELESVAVSASTWDAHPEKSDVTLKRARFLGLTLTSADE